MFVFEFKKIKIGLKKTHSKIKLENVPKEQLEIFFCKMYNKSLNNKTFLQLKQVYLHYI